MSSASRGERRPAERRLDSEGVIEKFGVPPEKVPDVQALIGDPTDNVPGVPGIGIKTAAQLIAEYGSLEALLDRTAPSADAVRAEYRRAMRLEVAFFAASLDASSA